MGLAKGLLRSLRLGQEPPHHAWARYRLLALRSWRMMGRDGTRQATVLNPARANVEAVPVKMLVVLFGASVSTG